MRQQRILITGVCGFTGCHLVSRLRREENVHLIGLDSAPSAAVEVDTYLPCDVADAERVDRAVGLADPDVVFHLAGLFGAASDAALTHVNVGGFTRLRDAIRRRCAGRRVRVVSIGSAAEIGPGGANVLPVTEEVPCLPDGPYGRTKWRATLLALNEPVNSPMEAVVARPFNLVGPGLSPSLALGSFARQVAAVARGEAEAVRCGTLDTRRDFVDVRDAVEAYVLLAAHGRPREIYNVCAGRSYRLGDLLQTLIELSGTEPPVRSDPSRHRAGVPDIYGDYTKIRLETRWQPKIPIRESLRDLLASVMIDSLDGVARCDPASAAKCRERGLRNATALPPERSPDS